MQVIMTADGTCDSRNYDIDYFSSDQLLQQILTTPIDPTDDFYNLKGNITKINWSEHDICWDLHDSSWVNLIGTRQNYCALQ